jgi:hypothetical protein
VEIVSLFLDWIAESVPFPFPEPDESLDNEADWNSSITSFNFFRLTRTSGVMRQRNWNGIHFKYNKKYDEDIKKVPTA